VESTGIGDGSDNVRPFAGTFLRGETPINFVDPDNMNISMDVLMDHAAMVGLKLENGLTVVNAPDNLEEYTTPNEWQTITWNFSDFPNDQFKTISLIFDRENIPTENKTYYFDNIRVAGTSCESTTSIFNFDPVPSFAVIPNPTAEVIRIESPEVFSRVEIYNTVGQKVITLRDRFQSNSQFDVSSYEPGIYFIQVFNLEGKLAGNGKFVKQ
ncbi:MAG: T9SS type A sorting domain-containing protein, partial [Saprospiraceae bacterium]|nr:T9SS type A sorting domain-containing protein [Saprospiraceae bacterium]